LDQGLILESLNYFRPIKQYGLGWAGLGWDGLVWAGVALLKLPVGLLCKNFEPEMT